ncbi:extracellular dioxygenase [Paraphoma chrysanthemicola]|uniref:Extracellular dioxygenase n=1 Tax=Paraphoma chrysanthemicola TaxID=798071 RepID=A0A8K0QRG8_9PLEO|nr:extracellular dioxygenase [Paraphoma chrysanthemicola]
MVQFSLATVATVAAFFSRPIFAHPGHDISAEIAERAALLPSMQYRNLDHCAGKLQARAASMIERRKARVEHLRMKRSITKRDFDTVLNTDHESNKCVTPYSPSDVIFGQNSSCILLPETTEGPYWVSGEYVRENITDGDPGVPLTFDVQIIDITTCEPLKNVALEAWHCNSTGVYGGIVSPGNGNTDDASNINNTMFRGIQISDDDGVLQFDTAFPGHYTNRTSHIHILAHINATMNLANSTISGGHVSHVGQLFFDQDLINAVESVAPYTTNQQVLLPNAEDGILEEVAADSDPVMNYVYLGDTVEEGIFGWITVGLNPNAVTTPSAAAYLDANGGHEIPGGGNWGPGPRPSGV